MLDHLSELVVKEVHGSGGYGMLVGPAASAKEIEASGKSSKRNRTITSRATDACSLYMSDARR